MTLENFATASLSFLGPRKAVFYPFSDLNAKD
jgi:hypothetical protein